MCENAKLAKSLDYQKSIGPESCVSNAQGYGAAERQSARSALDHLLRQHEKWTEAFVILKKVIPWELISPHDEEILWNYFKDPRLP